ncbi:small proline-rich protein 2B-like [Zootoca vivipara]|uniref:small proline-rich protein 2B-like n=1 Tax=Zootoca vivipara TaxID=8524 RepID=UPI00293BD27E|nr:small proline-rich protein 2B-like [Zootoca vivipara]
MAYQCRQPCLPPPIGVPQCATDSGGTCAPTCGDPCAEPCSAASYQSKQPCLPPPVCTPLCHTESAPAPTSTCNACEELCPAPSVEVSSAPCELPTIPANADPCAPPCATLCSSWECSGASAAPSREAVGSYVVPGSIVSLNPSGHVSVKPGPEVEAGGCESVFLDTYIPHFS